MNENNNNLELPKRNDENIQSVNPIPMPEPIINEDKNMEDVKKMAVAESKSYIVFLKDAYTYITTRNTSELFKLLCQIVIVILFVLAFSLPLLLLLEIFPNILIAFGIDFTVKTKAIINSIWYVLLSLFGIILFMGLCKTRFYNLVNKEELKKQAKKQIEKETTNQN